MSSKEGFGEIEFGLLDLLILTYDKIIWIALAVVSGALVAVGVSKAIPPTFTSITYLRLSPAEGGVAETAIKTFALDEALLAGSFANVDNLDRTRSSFRRQIRMSNISRTGAATDIYKLEVEQSSPVAAQHLSEVLLEKWRSSTKPRADKIREIQEEIRQLSSDLSVSSTILKRLSDASEQLSTSSDGRDSQAAAVLNWRASARTKLAELQAFTQGISKDSVLAAPTKPNEPTSLPLEILALIGAFISLIGSILIFSLRQVLAQLAVTRRDGA